MDSFFYYFFRLFFIFLFSLFFISYFFFVLFSFFFPLPRGGGLRRKEKLHGYIILDHLVFGFRYLMRFSTSLLLQNYDFFKFEMY
jgi:hypothetical protein